MRIIYIVILIFASQLLLAQKAPDVIFDNHWMQNNNSSVDANCIGKKIELPNRILKSDVLKDFKKVGNSLVWDYHIKAEEAQGIVAFFDVLELGNGNSIRAFSPLTGVSTRLFYSNDNVQTSSYALPLIEGEELIIEIISESQAAMEQVDFSISDVGVLFSLNDFGDASECYANINCSEGEPWQDQKKAVARYMTVSAGEIGFCTGALVNNTNEDCTNYFLSAQHCTQNATTEELGQYVFYFNYEAEGCDNPASEDGLDQQTVIGCQKIAESGDGSNPVPDRSDFSLLLLNSIPEAYNVYYAGWNRSPLDQLQGNGAIIQHPLADIKKISFWDTVEMSFTSADHLSVESISSANGEGITDPNSSGSPIFDAGKYIIGNITAGSSGCISESEIENPSAIGGRFEIHWDQCGTADNHQLKPWLDPANTGVMTFNGRNQCGIIDGINDILADHQVEIYPNPTSHTISINSPNDEDFYSEVFSVGGNLIMSNVNEKEIDISTLSRGMYFVKIYFEDKVVTKSFIKR